MPATYYQLETLWNRNSVVYRTMPFKNELVLFVGYTSYGAEKAYY